MSPWRKASWQDSMEWIPAGYPVSCGRTCSYPVVEGERSRQGVGTLLCVIPWWGLHTLLHCSNVSALRGDFMHTVGLSIPSSWTTVALPETAPRSCSSLPGQPLSQTMGITWELVRHVGCSQNVYPRGSEADGPLLLRIQFESKVRVCVCELAQPSWECSPGTPIHRGPVGRLLTTMCASSNQWPCG